MRVLWLAAACGVVLVAVPAHASRASEGFSISLSAEYRDTRLFREWSGFIALNIALDRFAAPRTRRTEQRLDQGQVEPFRATRSERRLAVRPRATRAEPFLSPGPRATRAERRLADGLRATHDEPRLAEGPPKKDSDNPSGAPPSSPAPAPAPASAVPLAPVLSSRLARGAVRHALASAGYLDARSRLYGLATRARTSAVLPELGVRTLRSSGQLLRLTPTADDPYRYTQAGTSELTIEARLTWHLDRLVFADEEVSLERLQIERDAAERRLIDSVMERLEVWQRGRVRAADPNTDPEQRDTAELAAIAAAVELDVLTDGWFSQAIGESEGPRAGASGEAARVEVNTPGHAR